MVNEYGEINYDELDEATAAIISGRATLARLNSKEEQGRIAGGRLHVEASLIIGGDRKTNRWQYYLLGDDEEKIAQREENLLKKFALKRGVWLDEQTIACDALKRLPSGAESDVYLSQDSSYVIKLVNYRVMSPAPDLFLDDRVSLHNYLFPDTKYELIGFTVSGSPIKYFRFVLKQTFIHGQALADPSRYAANRERLKVFMRTHFDMKDMSDTKFYNSNYIVGDLHLGNVLENEDGQFFFIDTVTELNTEELQYLNGVRHYGSWGVVVGEN